LLWVKNFRQGIRGAFSLFGPKFREGPGDRGRASGGRSASEWYQSKDLIFVFYNREKEEFTMPPRRERQSPDPEDREVRRRGRPAGNPEME
jgi:hypothetical protein